MARNPKHGAEVAALAFDVPTPDVHYAFDCLLTLAIKHDCGPVGTIRTDVGRIIGELSTETATVIDEVFVRVK